MNTNHDEIKRLLKASRTMLSNKTSIKESNEIRKKYNLITEQEIESNEDESDDTNVEFEKPDILKKINTAKSVEDEIENDTKSPEDKKQGYRISGGILVLHGKDQTELELTTDEKTAFQETMDEFVNEVSDLAEFNKLNVYGNNVEWSGKIIDFDVDFMISIGEENGLYLNGDMIKIDDKLLELINKLKSYFEKFKSKWAKILSSRKKTKKIEEK
jgi:hypothetical protein